MIIRPGTTDDLAQVRYLLGKSSRAFLNCGYEDLPYLLDKGVTVMGMDRKKKPWGLVIFHVEDRLDTLPDGAPWRALLRAAAHQRMIFAERPLADLFEAAAEELASRGLAYEMMGLTEQSWLNAAMSQASFEKREEIRFYVRTQHDIPPVEQTVTLRPLQPNDLAELAIMDSQTFDPIWHMGQSELMQLCLSSRIQVATNQGQLVGYTATTLRPSQNELGPDAQIVRVAVAPWARRMGIGRQLLADAIRYAHESNIFRIELNTQESNQSSQRLYESFGFRRHSGNIPVMMRSIAS